MSGSELIEEFSRVDTSDFPDFYSYRRILERALWVLWVAKGKLVRGKLTAEQIASIIIDVKEVSISPSAVAQSLRNAGHKIHVYHEKGLTLYKIMKAGEEHLLTASGEGAIQVFYFEAGKKYTPKRLLVKDILAGLTGELRIVDPYCSERTLDCLKDIKDRPIRFLTRIENLHGRAREQFLRELQDFKSEYPAMEFRDYPDTDLHDRYIISPSSLVILGHSIKDLGGKESFAIVLNKEISRNLIEDLSENFGRRWKQSTTL